MIKLIMKTRHYFIKVSKRILFFAKTESTLKSTRPPSQLSRSLKFHLLLRNGPLGLASVTLEQVFGSAKVGYYPTMVVPKSLK